MTDVAKVTAYLVVDFASRLLQIYGLLEDRTLLLQFDALGPVVEGASHVDFLGGMFPARLVVSESYLGATVSHEEVVVKEGRARKDGLTT